MKTININLDYDNLPNTVSKRQKSLDIMVFIVTKKTNNNISFDDRQVFNQIYSKTNKAVIANANTVNLEDDEVTFLRNCFIETSCTVDEAINLSKLETEILK